MTRISACDGRYLSMAQQRRAWEELNRIFGGTTPPPPGPDPPDPPVVSDWSVYFSQQAADIQQILMDQEVAARVITIEYSEGAGPQLLPVFTLSGMTPGEFVVLVTEIQNVEPCEGGRVLCGLFNNGEFRVEHVDGIPTVSKVNDKLMVEMFSSDGMGIVTYLTNFSPEAQFTSEMWSYTYSYDWAEGDVPGVCFMGFTANAVGLPMGTYQGTLGFAVLKEEVK